ncbi:hypothetical protein [Vibrio paucivorans]|uniref:Outer membrane protein beta-barrel domain-containing protein n=1 Tax=Vibrio paucivorans TaxID=2829489 RepID=A0A9X3CEY0_9VIBR|nr:hypothetical protein [Vibrio paucivorans]MCW8334440.1 hypothetical protein [Vibrio paucivorans]
MTFKTKSIAHFLFGCMALNSYATYLQAEPLQSGHWSHLPFWGETVSEMGYELPLPLGFGIYFNNQDVNYKATNDFQVGATGGLLGGLLGKEANYIVPAEDVDISGTDKSIQLKADAWVLPFLNIYGLLGYTEGNKDINVDLSNATRNGNPFNIPVTIPINLEYQAYNYGIGAVIASQIDTIEQIDPIIMTFSAAYTRSNTTVTDSSIETKIAAVRFGQKFESNLGRLTLLLGYQHQSIDQTISGSLTHLSAGGVTIADELNFNADITNVHNNNLSVLANIDFGPKKRWNLTAEYSFLNWNQLTLAAGYRF